MTNILGIGDHISCGSAVLRDGVFTSVIIDERLVREKQAFGVPRKSIRHNLELSGLEPQQVDRVAVATVNQHLINEYVDFRNGWFGLERGFMKQLIFDTASFASGAMKYLPFLPSIYYVARVPFFAKRRRAWRRILLEEFGIAAPVEFVNHHYCHATSAYYSSGFDDALIVSMDGGGDGLSGRIYDVEGGQFHLLHEIKSYDSLGVFYSYITQVSGFKAGRHEGKITGLAAHGEPKFLENLQKLMVYRDGSVENIGNMFFKSGLKRIRQVLPPDWDRVDLAASIQELTEDTVEKIVRFWLEKSGRTHVGLAGGLFANVAVNRRVHEIEGVQAVFVHPGMTDEGMPVGAAVAACYDDESTRPAARRVCMDHVYLGPGFSSDEIARELDAAGIAYQRCGNLEREVAELLAKGHVVARFNGRMEYGPRALGNRSILYQPTDPSVNDWLNTALKRTEFMPFAPATLWEEAERCYLGTSGATDTARFMTITFLCTPFMRETCPGVVHIDGTARPQLVRREDNPSFYTIIDEYRKITGIPSIINTSFNMHEEPIVCTPSDAVRAFHLGHLDYLAIGDFLCQNPSPIERPVLARAGSTVGGA